MPQHRDIVVIGASAGGVEALQQVVGGLPSTLDAAVFIVKHEPLGMTTVLPQVLGRCGTLRVAEAVDREPIERGRIYVAQNDHHLILEEGRIRLTKGPKENRFRPAVDPLFRSAAYLYGSRTIGVILSGALDDGTSGLWTIKHRGGVAVVQDPADAIHGSMPSSALRQVEVDHSVRASQIGPLLALLTQQPASGDIHFSDVKRRQIERELAIAVERNALEENVMSHGELTPFTCPECHGVLTLLRDGMIARYRCHTGHAFSEDALLSSAGEQTEARLWDAVRAMDETVMLLKHLSDNFARSGNREAAETCLRKAEETHARSTPIREVAQAMEQLSVEQLARAGNH